MRGSALPAYGRVQPCSAYSVRRRGRSRASTARLRPARSDARTSTATGCRTSSSLARWAGRRSGRRTRFAVGDPPERREGAAARPAVADLRGAGAADPVVAAARDRRLQRRRPPGRLPPGHGAGGAELRAAARISRHADPLDPARPPSRRNGPASRNTRRSRTRPPRPTSTATATSTSSSATSAATSAAPAAAATSRSGSTTVAAASRSQPTGCRRSSARRTSTSPRRSRTSTATATRISSSRAATAAGPPSFTQDNRQQVLLNDGKGYFRILPGALPEKPFGLAGEGQAVKAADLDHDGRIDLLLAYTSAGQLAPNDCTNAPVRGRVIQVLMGNGDGTFRDETSTRLPQPDLHLDSLGYYLTFDLEDLDGDGNPDLFTQLLIPPNGDLRHAPAFRNDGKGFFRPLPAGLPGVLARHEHARVRRSLRHRATRRVPGDLELRRRRPLAAGLQRGKAVRPGMPTEVRVTTDPETGRVVVAWPYVWGAARYEVWKDGRRARPHEGRARRRQRVNAGRALHGPRAQPRRGRRVQRSRDALEPELAAGDRHRRAPDLDPVDEAVRRRRPGRRSGTDAGSPSPARSRSPGPTRSGRAARGGTRAAPPRSPCRGPRRRRSDGANIRTFHDDPDPAKQSMPTVPNGSSAEMFGRSAATASLLSSADVDEAHAVVVQLDREHRLDAERGLELVRAVERLHGRHRLLHAAEDDLPGFVARRARRGRARRRSRARSSRAASAPRGRRPSRASGGRRSGARRSA